jgi:GTP-binding protein HflX
MNNSHDISDSEQETSVLVGVGLTADKSWQVERSLDELAELADTAGVSVVHREVQMRSRPDPATFVGRGKARKLKEFASAFQTSTIIFDADLAPVQSRNLEEITDCKIIDRTELILDIFAQHAHTREGKLQIELAQLTYMLPRLAGRYHELSRLGGGVGTRGPGEQKLEYDRRRIRERITQLKKQIGGVRRHRDTQRKKRRRDTTALVALVGYTNAGKSSLLNALTGAHAYVADQLFATLDPRSRRLELPNRQTVVLTDTVGFIRRLPHTLVASFRATLEEVVQADVLMHVVDASNSELDEQMSAVKSVLTEIEAGDKPVITVFNKTDLLDGPDEVDGLVKRTLDSAAVSATCDREFPAVLDLIERSLSELRRHVTLRIPQTRNDVVAYVHRSGQVIETEYENDCVIMHAELDQAAARKLEEYTE